MPRQLRKRIIISSGDEHTEIDSSDDDTYQDGDSLDMIELGEELMLNQLTRLKQDTPELYENFIQVRQYLESELPSIEDILQIPMKLKDKAHIVELYEAFIGCEPLSYDWIDAKHQLIDLIQIGKHSFQSRHHLESDIIEKLENELVILNNSSLDCDLEFEICRLQLPFESKLKIFKRYKKLESMDTFQEEYGKLYEWIRVIIQIPWGIQHSISDPIESIIHNLSYSLDSEFYGQRHVKEQLLLYVHHRLKYPLSQSYALGLVGAPGTGKTAIAHLISKILKFPFYQISGGSLSHQDNIYGHSYTYIGSDTGEIVKALLNMKAMNGTILIDEFDKIVRKDSEGFVHDDKCLNTFLHILDPEQNHNFKDNYIGDIPIDISRMWWILSMNQVPVSKPLLDRIFIIHVDNYTTQDKLEILEKFTLPKLLSQIKLPIIFTTGAFQTIVNTFREEKGMRQTIQCIQDIIKKLCFLKYNPDLTPSFHIKNWNESIPITSEMVNLLIQKQNKEGDNTYRTTMYM